MKAIVCHKYGSPDVLQLKEVEKPAPKDNEVLVKVQASSLNAADFETLRGVFFVRVASPLRPRHKILGSDIAGRVEAAGRNVKQFQPGDEVFGDLSVCGFGAFAEYVAVPESALAPKPASMTFEEAATYPQAAVLALQNLRGVGPSSPSPILLDKGPIQPGQKVLINGAGGGVGTFAVQLAKHYGAEVTGVDSTGKLDMLRSIGADHVIDYTQEDFTKSGETYDVIIDVVGKTSFSRSVRSLKQNGHYLIANPGLSQMVRGRWTSRRSGKKVVAGIASHKTEESIALKELIEAGKIRSVIDRRYPLEQIVEAHRYVETGHKKGNVVITVEPATPGGLKGPRYGNSESAACRGRQGGRGGGPVQVRDQRQEEWAGLEPNQEQLLAALRAQGIEGRRVLEIGCGTGHLHHRLLDEGAASVVGVEFSADYLAQAKALARAQGHEDRVTYFEGDFTELAGQIEPADVTILDKVVHCYEEPERLVRQSTAHTRFLYALTFPQDRWWIRLMIRSFDTVMRFFPMPWRVRFSRPEAIRAWVRDAGLVRLSHDETGMWHTEVYVRRGETGELGA